MDSVIIAHFYASTSFVATKCSYAFYYGYSTMSFHGVQYGIVAYLSTMFWLCSQDPELKKSAWLVAKIIYNKLLDKWRGPSKNRDKPVRKMRRLQKKKEVSVDETTIRKFVPIDRFDSEL